MAQEIIVNSEKSKTQINQISAIFDEKLRTEEQNLSNNITKASQEALQMVEKNLNTNIIPQ